MILSVIACALFLVLTAAAQEWETGEGHRHRRVGQFGQGSAGNAGFREMPAAQTGIVFSNNLTPWQIIQNGNFMNGSGVAAGDFDGDGLCDLYFCSILGTNRLYRNLGGWRFEDVTGLAGVGLPEFHNTGATFADLDGDSDLDLRSRRLGRGFRCFIIRGTDVSRGRPPNRAWFRNR